MKCLSVWQPFASLLAWRLKTIETRSWRCPLPLPSVIAIHAAKKDVTAELCHLPQFIDASLKVPGMSRLGGLPRGAVVAIGRLSACWSTNDPLGLSDQEKAFGDYSPGRWAWKFDLVYKLPEPIVATGRQGLWTWQPPADLAAWERQALEKV